MKAQDAVPCTPKFISLTYESICHATALLLKLRKRTFLRGLMQSLQKVLTWRNKANLFPFY